MTRLLLLVTFLFATAQSQNSCRYEHPLRGVIDLSEIGKTDGGARFNDLTMSPASSYFYSFNPCHSFSEYSCENVAACRITKDRRKYDVLGVQSRSTWTIDSDGNPVLIYNQTSTTLSITMACSTNNNDELELIGEGPINRFQMVLKSRCACWNACGGSRSTDRTTNMPPATSTQTIQWNSCRYYDSKQGVIDLSKIAKRHGKPRFKDIIDPNSDSIRWSYNPCLSFSEKDCHDVAACRIDKSTHSSVSVAVQTQTSWVNMDRNGIIQTPAIVYSSPLIGQKNLKVELVCDNTTSKHHLDIVGDSGNNEYVMRLRSRCACWNGCDAQEEFEWKLWMSIASGAFLIFSCLCCMMTCAMCCNSKTKRRSLVINEKTPIYTKA